MCCPGARIQRGTAGQAQPGAARQSRARAVPKRLSVSPIIQTTRKSPEMDAQRAKNRADPSYCQSSLLSSAQPLSGRGEDSSRSAGRNLASVLMDWDPGAAVSLVRRRGLAPGSDTPVLLTAPRGEQPQISRKRDKSNLPGGSRSCETISKDLEGVGKTPNPRGAARQGCPGFGNARGEQSRGFGAVQTPFPWVVTARKEPGTFPDSCRARSLERAGKGENQSGYSSTGDIQSPSPALVSLGGSFGFCSVILVGDRAEQTLGMWLGAKTTEGRGHRPTGGARGVKP